MRGFLFFVFNYYPLRYTASEQKTSLVTNAKFEVVFDEGFYDFREYPTTGEVFRDAAANLVFNPENLGRQRPLFDEPSEAEYIVITSNALSSYFEPLTDWEMQKGVTSEIVTVESIESSYPGTNTQAKIKNCILDYAMNKGSICVLLGGDNTIIPDYDCYCYVNNDNPPYDPDYTNPADIYYTGLDGTDPTDWNLDGDDKQGEPYVDGVDLYPDVIATRAGLRTSDDVTAFVNKTLNYEQNPPTSDSRGRSAISVQSLG